MSNRKNINSFLQSKFMRIDDYIFGEYIAEQNENNSSTSMRLLEKLNISDHICSTEDKASFKYHVVRPLCYIMLKTFVILILTWFWLKLRLQINYNGGFLPFLLKL